MDAIILHFSSMDGIEPKKMWQLWKKLLQKNRMTNSALAGKVGIGRSTPTNWRDGRVRSVNPSILKQIEDKLAIHAELEENGEWVVVYKTQNDNSYGYTFDIPNVKEKRPTYQSHKDVTILNKKIAFLTETNDNMKQRLQVLEWENKALKNALSPEVVSFILGKIKA